MRSKGQDVENTAATFLKKNGCKIITQNYHSRYGEIDLICLDKAVLVFAEIKYRKSTSYGTAAETVTTQKQTKIIKTAEFFLMKEAKYQNREIRFDVLTLEGDLDNEMQWIKAAFTS